jgi:monofunctional biosynthetic peptidoglycan transglycosylase
LINAICKGLDIYRDLSFIKKLAKMSKSSKPNSIWRKIKRTFGVLFLSSLGYLLLCKWVMPPITLTQLTSLISGDGLKRDYVDWDEISINVKLAAIASEDQLFAEHGGFDWKAIEKSIDPPAQRKKKQRALGAAASTISQQTAKNVFLWQGSGWGRYLRKIPELFYTKSIELVWGKKRIMEVYLNTIEMGKGIYGIEAAAQNYFHKSANSLSKSEAAIIIACLPNPKKFTVIPLSKRVSWRYPQILKQMSNLEGDEDVANLIR